MLEEIRNIRTGKSDIRKFGATFSVISGILAALFVWRAKQGYSILLVLSGLFLLMGLVLPGILKPIYKVWMTFSVLMGWVMTHVILSILFFVLLTPLGLFAKLFGHHFLDTEFRRDKSRSYWILKHDAKKTKEDYEKQF